MERRLAAIVSTDIVGYSRLMGADEVDTLARMKAHRREHWTPVIEKHGGRVVGTAGDSLLIEYASAVSAVESAIEVQEGMAAREADAPEARKMLLRIGVNIGEVVVDGDDIFGDGVNVAARLQAMASPGGICISGKVHEEVDGKLPASFADAGAYEVKNITRPVHVWRWVAEGQAAVAMSAETDGPLPLLDKPTIAVLPFDNMSGDPDQDYFADGMAEDIITALSKFRSFFVIARNSSFAFKGRVTDVTQVSKELSAKYVVEGSVRKSANRLRITAQLIEAESGKHIWAERYDRSLDDVFDIQDEITERVVGIIAPEISAVERKAAARKHPENLDAWGLLQRGLNFMWRWDRDGFQAAIEMFRRALAGDPSLSQAHSYLAFALIHMRYLGYEADGADSLGEAARRAREALSLDDTDSLAHAILARVLSHELRYDDSIIEAQRAVELNPNHAFAYQSLALMYVWANRIGEGLESVDQAIHLSPNDPFLAHMLATKGLILDETGSLAEAVDVMKAACRLPHQDYRPWLFLAAYAAESGELDLAYDAAARVRELRPGFTAAMFRQYWPHMHPAVHDSLAQKYVKAGLPEE